MSKRFNDINKLKSIDPNYLYQGEVFINVTQDMVPDVYEDYYMISNYGRVFHRYMGIFLKFGINGSGYYFCMLSTYNGPKPIQIHRLVMIAFNPVDGYEFLDVNHKDGCKTNPALYNLEWSTRSENIQHSYNTGLHAKNQDSCKTNLTNDTVIKVCELLQTNMYTNKQIADIVGNGVTVAIVSSIKKRYSWVDISKDYIFYSREGRKFLEDDVRSLCEYFSNNDINDLTVNQHCRNDLDYIGLDIDKETVDSARKIYNRKYYTKISCDYIF